VICAVLGGIGFESVPPSETSGTAATPIFFCWKKKFFAVYKLNMLAHLLKENLQWKKRNQKKYLARMQSVLQAKKRREDGAGQ
jgi:hypothetical protein